MPRGKWSFLHEWVIYEYLMTRFHEKTLRLRLKVDSGNVLLKEKWRKVTSLNPIMGTAFPDVELIGLANPSGTPAEVKFTTSLFDYHRQDPLKFKDFMNNHGIIIVLSHDYLPSELESYNVSVYEIDQADFTSFCRENFVRLLNRQIKLHTETKVWIMYQGPNFNLGSSDVKPARESHIWCPTENLSGFDLAIRDRVLFVKTRNASTQQVQNAHLRDEVYDNWLLDELYIAELCSTIYSRTEYCTLRKKPQTTPLWRNDEMRNGDWRWNRVFEFKHVSTVKPKVLMRKMLDIETLRGFILAATEAFCYNKSREISLEEYRDLLEYLTHG